MIAPLSFDALPDVCTDEHVRQALGLSRDQWRKHITAVNARKSGYTLPARIPVRERRYLRVDVLEWMRAGAPARMRRAA